MPVLNTIKNFIDNREISRYRFWQDTGLGRDTAYRLCNDPHYVPTGSVLEKICATYGVQPGDLLTWIPDSDSNQNLADPLMGETNNLESKTDVRSSPQTPSTAKLKTTFGSPSMTG
jgi:DNA-binding Xre family transcriptional regulator